VNEAQWIQVAFPSEPDWSEVSSAVLVELVEGQADEPSCAQSALTELKRRSHPETERLCYTLLSGGTADKWLRAGALGILLSLNPLSGLDAALQLVEHCEMEIFEEIIEAMNYEHQGSLSGLVHQHPIVPFVKARLAQSGGNQVVVLGKLLSTLVHSHEPPNPSIERTSLSRLRRPKPAAHVER
jgi:hypothetical protein